MSEANVEREQANPPVCISVKDQTAVLGGVLWLCQYSTLHLNFPVGMLVNRVAASIELNQFRYFENGDGVPVGFCNWAYLSDELLQRALDGHSSFETRDWRSGKNFFIPEMLAPFGHLRKIVRDLRENIVPRNQRVWSVRGQILRDEEQQPLRVQNFLNR